ncbi:MAG TPA: class I SAM-dependent methyltransferase [Streptosporangiaceae bacterium]|nr:class I SAM-dependent methyltransferase [Streptosporangiaceae bacterium]
METAAETEERLRHASSFGAVAAAYAEHRPTYADAAIRWCLEPVSGTPRVVDLGAGTGILTAALTRLGADVTAIEPDQDMLAELRRHLPGVPAEHGTAESIPLPDASVDAVLAGQAMHWFDMDRALPEIARVLRPGGVLAGLWNVDDDRVGWVAELDKVARRKASITMLRWHNGVAASYQERAATSGGGLFDAAETSEFANGQVRTVDSLVASIATHSNLLVMTEPERQDLLAQVSDFLRGQPETSAGEFTLPLITVAVRARRA